MSHTRAYLAGFGTGGALVACAALVFVVASALVAFNGMPGEGATLAPLSVTMPTSGAGAQATAATRLAAVAAATPAALGAARAPGRHAGGGRAVRGGGASGPAAVRRVTVGAPLPVRGGGSSGGTGAGSTTPVPLPGGVTVPVPSEPATVLSRVTSGTRQVVQTVTGGTDSTVSRVGQSLGLGTPPRPLPVGAGRTAGGAAGSAVSGVSSAAGGAVSGVSHTAGGVAGSVLGR